MTGTNAKPEGKGTSRVATQGAIGGLLLGVAAFLVRPKAPRVSAEATTTERHKTLLLEDAAAALSPAEITAISTSFGSTQPVGKFLRGRHGVTHYYLQSPESRGTGQTFLNAAGASRLIVMTHGIGTNMQLYDKVVSALLDDGFTVLRYDYFGHGWSAPDDKYSRPPFAPPPYNLPPAPPLHRTPRPCLHPACALTPRTPKPTPSTLYPQPNHSP